MMLQLEVVALCRDLACLSQPPVYVDYVELETEVRGPEETKMVVDNMGDKVGIKTEMVTAEICNEGLMASQLVPSSN